MSCSWTNSPKYPDPSRAPRHHKDQVKKLRRAALGAPPAASAVPGGIEKSQIRDNADSESCGDLRGHVLRTRAPMSKTLPPTAGSGRKLARE